MEFVRGGDCQAKQTGLRSVRDTITQTQTYREPRTFWRREERGNIRMRERGRIEWREGRERENEGERAGGATDD